MSSWRPPSRGSRRSSRELNAFVHLDPEGALAAADAVGPGDARPFAGVPIAIKDTAPGGRACRSRSARTCSATSSPRHDSYVVRRLREAGFVIVGKTNMPEFGILPVTEPRRFGPARNPWDTERTPGGSSGGAAAAVASGMVPIAHGSDGGGSIRIPAACCGLVGLKPSRGRVSRGPDQGDDFLVQDGVLSRTVAETAELLDVLAGYELGDATWAPPPAEPFATRRGARARAAAHRRDHGDADRRPSSTRGRAARVPEAAELLASLGHEVEEFEAPWAGEDLLATFTLVFGTPIAPASSSAGSSPAASPRRSSSSRSPGRSGTSIRERSRIDYLLARTQLQAVSRG